MTIVKRKILTIFLYVHLKIIKQTFNDNIFYFEVEIKS